MSKDKVKKITLYVENKGRGKVVIVDSKISIQDFPAFNSEGKKAIGVNATPVDVLEKGLKGFVGMVEVRHPHQLNILTADEYEATKKKALEPVVETEDAESSQEKLAEKDLYDKAMAGGDDEILAYMEAYKDGKYIDDVIERSVFLTAKDNDARTDYEKYLKKYPQGKYVQEINTILAG